VIAVFLHSLTELWDGKLIAVIVSGYDGDGAGALCGIKEEEGRYYRTDTRDSLPCGHA
jgi:two-component system chemotaxis response regulator CheB